MPGRPRALKSAATRKTGTARACSPVCVKHGPPKAIPAPGPEKGGVSFPPAALREASIGDGCYGVAPGFSRVAGAGDAPARAGKSARRGFDTRPPPPRIRLAAMKLAMMFPNPLSQTFEQVAACAELGVEAVQVKPQAFVSEEFDLVGDPFELAAPMTELNVHICALSGYRSLIGPAEEVSANLDYLTKVIDLADALRELSPPGKLPVVVTETGDPRKQGLERDAAMAQVVESCRALAAHAEERSVILALEPTRSHIVDRSRTALKVLTEVGSGYLQICFDPANTVGDKDTLDSAVERLGANTVLAHAKDVKFDEGKVSYPPAGKGTLDYREVIGRLSQASDVEHIVIEYVRTPEEATEAVQFLKPLLS